MLSARHTIGTTAGHKFKATLLWHSLVEYVQLNVKQKRRRLILKGVGPTDCFSGSDLCDTVLLYLLMDNENFKTSDLTRDKAAKLCQMLIEQQVIEPLSGSTSSLEKRFDDAGSKYYKFTDIVISSKDDQMNGEGSIGDNTSSDFLPRPDDKMRIHQDREPDLLEDVISNPSTGMINPHLDCSGHVIQQLMGITHQQSTPSRQQRGPFSELNNKIHNIYADKISKRSSLDIESAMVHGKMSRNLSSHVNTPGHYRKRKLSMSDIQTDTCVQQSENQAADKFGSIRRGRRASADLEGYDYRQGAEMFNRNTLAESKIRRSLRVTSRPKGLPSRAPAKHMTRIHSDTDIPTDGGAMRSLNPISCKSVEKLAKLTGDVIFSPAAIADLRQEIALSQLSQIIDLPILEGLVCAGAQQRDEPGYDNTVFFNGQDEIDSEDSWLKSAIEVFDHIPNGHKTTFDYSVGLNPGEYKLALYRSILKNYRSRSVSLFPSCHESIHLGVLSLVMSGVEQKAVLAVRLAAILLPCYLVAEICALLDFLHVVSVSSEPKVKPGQNNNDAILNDYSGIFFMNCKLLSMDQRRILLLLLMRYHSDIARVPRTVEKALELSMQSLKQGDDTPTPSFLYCNKITSSQLQRQTAVATEKALVALVKKIMDDTNLSLKDKQKHIKQFQKHHPNIMTRHFSDLA